MFYSIIFKAGLFHHFTIMYTSIDTDVCLLLTSGFLAGQGQNQALWVASDYRNIPPGAIIINPQTGNTTQDRIERKLLRADALKGFLLNL